MPDGQTNGKHEKGRQNNVRPTKGWMDGGLCFILASRCCIVMMMIIYLCSLRTRLGVSPFTTAKTHFREHWLFIIRPASEALTWKLMIIQVTSRRKKERDRNSWILTFLSSYACFCFHRKQSKFDKECSK